MLNCNDYNLVNITQGDHLDRYVKILKENNLKVTPQRIKILKYLDCHRTHPTADEIYSNLKESIPSLSKTTVYNSLDTLREHGLIQTLSICGSEHRYDFNHEMHHHFYCKKCGKIVDINIKCPNIEKIKNEGYRIDEVHGYFKGICKDCMNKEKKNNE